MAQLKREYCVTSLENWKKYEETGDCSLLNDIEIEDINSDNEFMLSWEGGAIPVELSK